MSTEVAIALDFSERAQADRLIQTLGAAPVVYKVGLELFTAPDAGPAFVADLVKAGRRVFLDLKLHDIPNTIAKAYAQIAKLGVECLTVHAANGSMGFKAIQSEAQVLKDCGLQPPRLLSVTVLTSFDEMTWADLTVALAGQFTKPGDSARGLAERSLSWGAQGLVCSAQELESLSARHPGTYFVVPGIRPHGFERGDQARVMTPDEAASLGASLLVIGRPITQHSDPAAVLSKILQSISRISAR